MWSRSPLIAAGNVPGKTHPGRFARMIHALALRGRIRLALAPVPDALCRQTGPGAVILGAVMAGGARMIGAVGMALAGVAALVLAAGWWAEAGARRQARAAAAWTVILAARGLPGDGGRRAALEALAENGAGLDAAPLAGAWVRLPGAKLSHARLRDADLAGADLRLADATWRPWMSKRRSAPIRLTASCC